MSNSITFSSFRTFKRAALVICLPIAFLYACASDGNRGDKSEEKKEETKQENKNSNLIEISGKIFSIPSPIQTAFLLKNSGAEYTSDLLNNVASVANYATTDQKALNLGIYGADLGYATIYDQTQEAISYMAVTKRLSSELGISNLFNESMVKRFEANLGNQDSLLALVSDAFKSADGYLKSNKQDDISVLILAGGWIETLHFATSLVSSMENDAIKNRIGEQKITIKNLINLMLPYQEKPQIASIINQLNELKDIYETVEFTYTYVEPTTDEENKITTINSESTVNMTEGQLNDISTKINEIRSSIIN